MAKPVRIRLSRRTPVARAASNVLRAVLLDLLDKASAARGDGSKKEIHDLRVEMERLASAAALAAMLDRLQVEGVPTQLAARIESIEQDAAPGKPAHEFARERARERLLDVRARWAAARRE